MKQKIVIKDSQDVNIVQAGGDVYYHETKGGERDASLPSPTPQAPFEFELTPIGFKSFVKAKGIRAERLISNMDFSCNLISKAQSELAGVLSRFKGISILLCGSFYRLEANRASDADFFAIFGNNLSNEAIDAMMVTVRWFNREGIEVDIDDLKKKLQRDGDEGFEKGRFPTLFPIDKLLTRMGTKDDSDEWRTRRMCILTESFSLHNQRLFNQVKEELFKKYLADIDTRINRLPEILLSDFKSWCSSLENTPWIREGTSNLFRIKAEHQRKFAYNATLLAFASSLIQGTEDAFEKQLSIFNLPPLLRLLWAIRFMSGDLRLATEGIIKELIEAYNDSFKILSDEHLRKSLKEGLEDKEAQYIKRVLDENGTRIKENFSKLWNCLPRDATTQLSLL